jgi:transposase
MITVPAGIRVLVASKPVDFRRGAESLIALVREHLGHDPFSETIYVFRSKRGQLPTFCISFSFCDNRLSLASVVRTDIAGLAVSPWEGIDVYLHGRAARPYARVAELDVR